MDETETTIPIYIELIDKNYYINDDETFTVHYYERQWHEDLKRYVDNPVTVGHAATWYDASRMARHARRYTGETAYIAVSNGATVAMTTDGF